MREKTACFTGHREIPKRDMRKIRQNTLNAIIKAYENGLFRSGTQLQNTSVLPPKKNNIRFAVFNLRIR